MLGLLLILSNIQRGLERDGRLGDSTRRMLTSLKALICHHLLGRLNPSLKRETNLDNQREQIQSRDLDYFKGT